MGKELQIELKKKSDGDLLKELKEFRGDEKKVVTVILRYLLEVEERMLHAGMQFADMYEFCMEELVYSEDEAYLRVRAMELLKVVPEAEKMLRSGNLTLTVAAKAEIAFRQEDEYRMLRKLPVLTPAEKSAVVAELENESTRKANRILVTHCPHRKKRKELTKPVDAETDLIQFYADAELRAMFSQLQGLLAHKNYSARWDLFFKELARITLEKIDPVRQAEKAEKRRARRAMRAARKNAPAREANAMNAAGTESHIAANDSEDLGKLPSFEMDGVTAEVETERCPAGNSSAKRIATIGDNEPMAASSAHTTDESLSIPHDANLAVGAKRSTRRYISVHKRRAVWIRAGCRCEYFSPVTGSRCTSTHALQIDHVQPLALGGTDDLSNFRLLCSVHNKFMAYKMGLGFQRKGQKIERYV